MNTLKKKITEEKRSMKISSATPSRDMFINKKVSNNLFISNIGDLGQGRLSFFRFLFEGLAEELLFLNNPIFIKGSRTKKDKVDQSQLDRIYFYSNDIKIKLLDKSAYTVASENGTYSAQIYVLLEHWSTLSSNITLSAQISNELWSLPVEKSKKESFSCEKHYLCIAEIPFITEEGSFVINGCERVIINQIIRSPGVYFKTERVKVIPEEGRSYYKLVYTGTVISITGRWTKICLDAQPAFGEEGILCNDSPYIKRPFVEDDFEGESTSPLSETQDWSMGTALKDLRKSDNTLFYLYAALSKFALANLEIRDSLKYPNHYEDEYLKCRDYDRYSCLEDFKYLENKENYNYTEYYESKLLPLPGSRMSLVKEIDSFYSGSQKFALGKVGRSRINARLNLNLPDSATFLTVHDLIAVINTLLDFRHLAPTSQYDDIDHIKNKQIRSVGELIQKRFRSGLARAASLAFGAIGLKAKRQDFLFDSPSACFEDGAAEETDRFAEAFDINEAHLDEEDKILFEEDFLPHFKPELETKALGAEESAYIKFARAFKPSIIGTEIKRFFTTSDISQFFDQTNPISSITHKRRISVFGPNGLQRDHVGIAIRDIHPSQYGRICPVETSEGHNAGLVTSLALLGQVSSLGWIEAPYFYAESSRVFATEHPIFLSPQAESELMTCFTSMSLAANLEISDEYSSVKEDYVFSTMKSTSINFVSVSPLQILSAATTLIPFLEHNDANRVLMGANMQRQAVPLIFPQKPIVGTGLEAAIAAHSSMVVKSFCSGLVLASSAVQIIVLDITSLQKIFYSLQKNFCSNQETSINQKPAVWAGETVAFNQIISDGPGIVDSELSLGQNLLVAYMPWEGYNYEDAIIINQRLLDEDCLTSVHIEEQTTQLKSGTDKLHSEMLTQSPPQTSQWLCRHLDQNTKIAKIGSYVNEYDVLVGKKVAVEASRLSINKLINLSFPDGLSEAKENEPFFVTEGTSKKAKVSLKLSKGEAQKMSSAVKIKYIFQNTSLCVPKGIEGKVIEIIQLNFDEFSSKKYASSLDAYNFEKTISIFIAQARKAQVGDKLAGRHGNKGIISKILASRDMPHLPDGTPIDILLNPLGVPSRMNVGQVFEGLLGLAGTKLGSRFKIAPFDEAYGEETSRALITKKLKEAAKKTALNWLFNSSHPGKIFLRDGRTGEYFDNPITVGISYILKLIHMADDKIHARATGPYAKITEQPLAGKSREGGQRFGEMEAWALEAFGCSNILQELFTIKSDDMDSRTDMYSVIATVESIPKPSPTISETYLVLVRELNSLGLDFSARKAKNSFSSSRNNGCSTLDLFETVEERLKLRQLIRTIKLFNYMKIPI